MQMKMRKICSAEEYDGKREGKTTESIKEYQPLFYPIMKIKILHSLSSRLGYSIFN